MNGPQHYREAERILREGNDRDDWLQAQVHATLALAAATADAAKLDIHTPIWTEVTR